MFRVFNLYKFLTKREKFFFNLIFFGIFTSTVIKIAKSNDDY